MLTPPPAATDTGTPRSGAPIASPAGEPRPAGGAAAPMGPGAPAVMVDSPMGPGDGLASTDGGVPVVDGSAPSDPATLITVEDAGGSPAPTGIEPPSVATFPPVMDPGSRGPYTPAVTNNTGPGGAFTVHHPQELAPDGVRNPIVTWGNGGATTPVDYPQLPHLASHGFVVVASNSPLVTGAEVKSGLDWMIAQNSESGSPFFDKLDTERVGGAGYSFGGLATLDNSDDPRYATIMIISGGSMPANRAANIAKVHTPAAYFCTDDDASESNCAGDYEALTVPTFFGVLNGSEHVHVTTFLGLGDQGVIGRLNSVMVAWFRWYLMDDESFRGTFLGEDCDLCKDSAWTVYPQKNW